MKKKKKKKTSFADVVEGGSNESKHYIYKYNQSQKSEYEVYRELKASQRGPPPAVSVYLSNRITYNLDIIAVCQAMMNSCEFIHDVAVLWQVSYIIIGCSPRGNNNDLVCCCTY